MYLVNGGHAVTEQLAKRIIKLAWDKSSVVGLGFLKDNGPLNEDDVWSGVRLKTEDDGGHTITIVDADYVHGRMMKFTFIFGKSIIKTNVYQSNWTPDYQSFCVTYPNFDALVRAAAESLDVKVLEAI